VRKQVLDHCEKNENSVSCLAVYKSQCLHHAIAGVIMQVSERGTGVFGCGLPTREGVVKFEAMKWMLSILNKRTGPNFLPDISIGKSITSAMFRNLCLMLQKFKYFADTCIL
jgi:hypothetical protein